MIGCVNIAFLLCVCIIIAYASKKDSYRKLKSPFKMCTKEKLT